MSGQPFLSETRERFLKAILKELPVERVREIYIFQPIKQGGVESGVAVVAGVPELETTPGVGGGGSGANDGTPDVVEVTEPEGQVPIASEAAPEAEPEDQAPEPHDALSGAAVELPHGTDESQALDEEVMVSEAEVTGSDGAAVTPDSRPPAPDEVEEAPDSRPAAPDAPKYTVYTARYRHVLKGPDRGKWEASLVAEAEAPLLSIETVVRGVQRRSGDVEPPDHMTAADIRAALRLATPEAGETT